MYLRGNRASLETASSASCRPHPIALCPPGEAVVFRLKSSPVDDLLREIRAAQLHTLYRQMPIAVAVKKYATFIQSTPDHVVNSALKIVIWRDVDFRRWRKQTQAERKDIHAAPKAARA